MNSVPQTPSNASIPLNPLRRLTAHIHALLRMGLQPQMVFESLLALLLLLAPLSTFWPLGVSAGPGIFPFYATPGIFFSDFPLIGLLLFALSQRRQLARRRTHLGPAPGVMLALAGLAWLGVPWALSPGLAAYWALRWSASALLLIILVQMSFDDRRMRRMFLIGVAVHGLIAVLQAVRQAPLGLPGEWMLPLEVDRRSAVQVADGWWLRSFGLTFHPNVLGGISMLGILMGIVERKTRLAPVLGLLITAGFALSLSKAAWLALALLVVPLGLWLVKNAGLNRRSLIVWSTLSLVVIIPLALLLREPLGTRLNALGNAKERASLEGRAELLATAIQITAARPLSGVGAGNFPLAMLHANDRETPHPVHNLPMLLTAELGLPGGVLWLVLWLWPIGKLERALRRRSFRNAAPILAWLGWCLIGLWDFYPWGLPAGQLISVFLLAQVIRGDDGEQPAGSSRS